MKKILALLLACIMLTAVLTGCGNKESIDRNRRTAGHG